MLIISQYFIQHLQFHTKNILENLITGTEKRFIKSPNHMEVETRIVANPKNRSAFGERTICTIIFMMIESRSNHKLRQQSLST